MEVSEDEVDRPTHSTLSPTRIVPPGGLMDMADKGGMGWDGFTVTASTSASSGARPPIRKRLSLSSSIRLDDGRFNKSLTRAAPSTTFGTPSYPSPLDRIRTTTAGAGRGDKPFNGAVTMDSLSSRIGDALDLRATTGRLAKSQNTMTRDSRSVSMASSTLASDLASLPSRSLHSFSFTTLGSGKHRRESYNNVSATRSLNMSTSLGASWQFRNFNVGTMANEVEDVKNPNKALVTIDKRSKILMANTVTYDMFGYDQNELIGKNFKLLLAKGARDKQSAIAEKINTASGELVVISGKVVDATRKDGTKISISLWVKRLNQAGEDSRFIIVMERVERAQSNIVFGNEGHILTCDGDFEALFNLPLSKAIGYHISSFIPQIQLPSANDPHVERFGEPQRLAGRTPDGTAFPLSVVITHGMGPGQWVGIVRVFKNISGMVCCSMQGTILDCNNNFTRLMFGYTLEELKGNNMSMFIKKLYDSMVYDEDGFPVGIMQEPADDGERCLCVGSFKVIATHKAGSEINVILQLKKIVTAGGHEYMCCWIMRDFNVAEDRERGGGFGLSTQDSMASIGSSSMSLGKSVDILPDPQNMSSSKDMDVVGGQAEKDPYEGEFNKHYVIANQIGKGAFGFVNIATRKVDDQIFVVKFIDKSKVLNECWTSDAKRGRVPLEVSLLSKINHASIVSVEDVFSNRHYYHLVMLKHGPGMDLFDYIDRNPDIPEACCAFMFRQVTDAVYYLHTKLKIVHRDIKDENIIIDELFNVKLIDFGSASFIKPGAKFKTFCGTLEYCSPEVLLGNQYPGPELEVWSMGITLYTLVYGENPFYDIDETIRGELDPPFIASPACREIVEWMLEPDPARRATVSQILEHEWINTNFDPENAYPDPNIDENSVSVPGFGERCDMDDDVARMEVYRKALHGATA